MASSFQLSGPFKALTDKPLDFLKKNAIVFDLHHITREYLSEDGATFRSGTAVVKLVKTPTANVYGLQFVANKDFGTEKEAIKAFVLGAKDNKGNNDAPFVDILKKNAKYLEGDFLFTVGLTGCSVIVTDNALDGKTYRVFHDRRMDSAVLYDKVEMCVNFNDYRIGGRSLSRTGSAITCMQFKDGAWKMFLQRQVDKDEVPKGSPNWEAHAAEKKGPLSAQSLEKEFNDRRVIIQKRVKANGGILKVGIGVIDGAKDGVVGGVTYNEEAVKGWEALRNAITQKTEAYRKDPNRDPKLRDTYRRFEDDVMASKDMDETWIWLQIKKIKAKAKH